MWCCLQYFLKNCWSSLLPKFKKAYIWSHLMVTWFMMKPIMHLCIKDSNPLKLIFSEPSITLLNLISYFKNHLLRIGKSNHHSFNIWVLITSCHEPYSSLSQLANKFSVSKVDCDGKSLSSAKKSWRFHYFFFNQQCTMYLLKSLFFWTNYS